MKRSNKLTVTMPTTVYGTYLDDNKLYFAITPTISVLFYELFDGSTAPHRTFCVSISNVPCSTRFQKLRLCGTCYYKLLAEYSNLPLHMKESCLHLCEDPCPAPSFLPFLSAIHDLNRKHY